MKILVNILSSALGDSIAAIPSVSLFKEKQNCDVYVLTKWKHILKDSYKNLIFIDESEKNNFYDKVIDIKYHFDKPIQEGFALDLGFTYWDYIRPKIDFEPQKNPFKNKYVSIGVHSTAQCKYWNYPDGWDILCRALRKHNITPVCIDQHETFGIENNWNVVPKSSVKRLNNSIEETMNYIYHSEFFIGLSSGLSWLAHALNKKVVMISGITESWNEFDEDCIRIINKNVCNGCFHKVDNYQFDDSNWMWCGEYGDSERQFECTKTITPQHVMSRIVEHGWV